MLRNIKIVTISFFFICINFANASEICSRIATINFQEVLVDTNSNQKGEGLRFYLEKDEMAKVYLDKYKDGSKIKWQNALLGTIGTGLVIAGLVSNSDSKNKTSLILGGSSLIAINFLIAKTFSHANEKNLIKAINEYNKRNLPKIFFTPSSKVNGSLEPGIFISKTWEFL